MGSYFPLYDTFHIGALGNMEIVPGTPKKQGRALMSEGYFAQPRIQWEQRIDNGYPNVFFDDDAGIYRMYYTCIVFDEDSTRETPAERVGKTYRIGKSAGIKPRVSAVLYAQSEDGETWVRPNLGIVEYEGSTNNNIILYDAHGASVFKDTHETDPAKRFKMMVRHDAKNEMAVCFSADGVHFSKPIPWPEYNPAGDTHNFAFYDDRLGRYVLITRTWDGLRLVARCESDDFIHWEKPEDIYRGVGLDDQIYSMPVFRHYDNYVGLASIFHGGDQEAEDFDCVDLELTYSHDGRWFDRIGKGHPFIPRGLGKYGSGVPDAACIYASVPVERGDQLTFYYMGGTGQHTNYRESSLMKCTIDREKLAGCRPKDERGGWVMSPAMVFTGEDVYIAADVQPGGCVEYAVRSAPAGFYAQTGVIPNYDFSDAEMAFHSGRIPVKFRGRTLSGLGEDEDLVLMIRARNATVYGFGGDVRAKHPHRRG